MIFLRDITEPFLRLSYEHCAAYKEIGEPERAISGRVRLRTRPGVSSVVYDLEADAGFGGSYPTPHLPTTRSDAR
jgi:hypothetical protein